TEIHTAKKYTILNLIQLSKYFALMESTKDIDDLATLLMQRVDKWLELEKAIENAMQTEINAWTKACANKHNKQKKLMNALYNNRNDYIIRLTKPPAHNIAQKIKDIALYVNLDIV